MILIVDDHPDLCRAVRALLKMWGHDAICAHNGPEGLALVRAALPELVILDVMMPGMDGLEVLRAIKADPATAGVPVVMYSASPDPRHVAEAGRLGAKDFVSKGGTGWVDQISSLLPPSGDRPA